MVGMMLPSTVPMTLFYAAIVRKNRERGTVLPAVWLFTGGHLLVWTAFSLGATTLQVLFEELQLASSMMVATSKSLSGVILIGAGTYQWSRLKDKCLAQCRSTIQFITGSLAGRTARRPAHGRNPRPLLPRLLLGDHVVAFRWRRHEFAVGHDHRWFCLVGEAHATWPPGRAYFWARPYWWWRLIVACVVGGCQQQHTVVVTYGRLMQSGHPMNSPRPVPPFETEPRGPLRVRSGRFHWLEPCPLQLREQTWRSWRGRT